MRGFGDYRERLGRTFGIFVVSASLLAGTGCAKRLKLSPKEFERIDKQEQAREDLRVYVSKKLIVLYELEDDNATYEVDGTVRTSSDQQMLKVIVARNTRGLILDTDEKNGAPLMWVTFSSRCKDKDCAYGFVQSEDGVFRLTSVPEIKGYKPPKPYFKRDPKKPLKLGKLKSLAEKNEVYLWKNKRGKVSSIDLIIKKRSDDKTRTNVVRSGGVD